MHIPKTAGVSIRNILKDHFREGFVLWYWEITGADGEVCPDIPVGATCVHGHYAVDVLADRFPQATLVTWVRDPVERVVSSYYHRLREPDWRHPVTREIHERKLSLLEYAELPLARNEMTTFFGKRTPDDFAFIGLVEEFARSLAVMTRILGLPQVEPRRDNANPAASGRYDLLPATRARLQALNEQDIVLYRKCLRRWSHLVNQV
jgi:Sulfotransferase family